MADPTFLNPRELASLKKIATGKARSCPSDDAKALLRLKLIREVPGGLELTAAGLKRVSVGK
jgi:hypothetical protein